MSLDKSSKIFKMLIRSLGNYMLIKKEDICRVLGKKKNCIERRRWVWGENEFVVWPSNICSSPISENKNMG